MSSNKVSLRDIATQAGVSVKTVSGALHSGAIRMSDETRGRIKSIADELGYVPNVVARGMRQGVMPIVGVLADGLITQPFATDIMRSFDSTLRAEGLSVIVTNVGSSHSAESGIVELRQLMPQKIAYASMYHHIVALSDVSKGAIALMINCRDASGTVPALVPAETQAGETITDFLISRGRRAIAFLNLPGLIAGKMREDGFRKAHATHDLAINEDFIKPATRGALYSDRGRSLVPETVARWLAAPNKPDAILCGNDRVAMEVYGTLRRLGVQIPQDIAVASFDNQVDIATRLDPPLTTMALPHRELGRRAGEIISGNKQPTQMLEEIPFRLIQRASV